MLAQFTCAATMVSASHCVGLTLPGMMELPGSFSGSSSSPSPHLHTGTQQYVKFVVHVPALEALTAQRCLAAMLVVWLPAHKLLHRE